MEEGKAVVVPDSDDLETKELSLAVTAVHKALTCTLCDVFTRGSVLESCTMKEAAAAFQHVLDYYTDEEGVPQDVADALNECYRNGVYNLDINLDDPRIGQEFASDALEVHKMGLMWMLEKASRLQKEQAGWYLALLASDASYTSII